jgi:APA family basic amino acid/polyamine antiporter
MGDDTLGAIGGGMAIALFIWHSRNTGHSFLVHWAPFFLAGGALLLGILVYAARRRHLVPSAPVPPYR